MMFVFLDIPPAEVGTPPAAGKGAGAPRRAASDRREPLHRLARAGNPEAPNHSARLTVVVPSALTIADFVVVAEWRR
jgi:hypothetical protein